MRYAIARDDDGIVVSIVDVADLDALIANAPAGTTPHPCADPSVQPGRSRWTGAAIVAIPPPEPTPAEVEAQLVTAVKAEAERRKMLVRSPGSGKGNEYRLKRDDAIASTNVATAALNALSKGQAIAKYPAAALERQLTGEPLATILARYRQRATDSDTEVLRLAAVEWKATAAIKAAATVAAKRAAHAGIDWSWSA